MGIHEVQNDNATSNKYPAESHSGRSQHFSCPHNSVTALLLSSHFGYSTSLVLTFRSQHFYLSLQFRHSTSLFPTINPTTTENIITKLLSVIPVFHIWCFLYIFPSFMLSAIRLAEFGTIYSQRTLSRATFCLLQIECVLTFQAAI